VNGGTTLCQFSTSVQMKFLPSSFSQKGAGGIATCHAVHALLILFFILLGSQLSISGFRELIVPGLILSLLVLIGNPLILMAIMGFLGYRKRTSLQTGLTVAQISEFSLILVALGVSFGQVSRNSLSLVTLVGIITIFGSTYLILYSDKIYSVLRRYLSVFERAGIYEKTIPAKQYPFILFGCNRIGLDFLEIVIVKPPFFHGAGAEIFDHDVGPFDKLFSEINPFFCFQVYRHAVFVIIADGESP